MAHTPNFEVPARLVFQPRVTNWVTCSAETLDWSVRDSIIVRRTADMKGNMTITMSYERHRAKKNDEVFHAVLVGIDLTGVKPADVVTRDDSSSGQRKVVTIYHNDLPPSILQPWEEPNTQPHISGRTFTVLARPSRFLEERDSPADPVKDAWTMRNEFLNLEQNDEALRQFLNKWGRLTRFQAGVGRGRGSFDSMELEIPHLIWKLQAEFRRALVGAPARWLRSHQLQLQPTRTTPFFIVEPRDCDDAISATITIDHLSSVKFGICKRTDCRKLFAHTSKQKRVYCSHSCAHLVSVRNQRKKERTLKAKQKGANADAARKD